MWRADSTTCCGVVRNCASTSFGSRLRKNAPSIRTAMRRTLIDVHRKKKAPRFRHTLWIVERAYSRGRMCVYGGERPFESQPLNLMIIVLEEKLAEPDLFCDLK